MAFGRKKRAQKQAQKQLEMQKNSAAPDMRKFFSQEDNEQQEEMRMETLPITSIQIGEAEQRRKNSAADDRDDQSRHRRCE